MCLLARMLATYLPPDQPCQGVDFNIFLVGNTVALDFSVVEDFESQHYLGVPAGSKKLRITLP